MKLGKPAAASRWWPTKCSAWPNARPTRPTKSKGWYRTIPGGHQRGGGIDGAQHNRRRWRRAARGKCRVRRCRKSRKCPIRSPVWCRIFLPAPRGQSTVAQNIARNMQVLREIQVLSRPIPPARPLHRRSPSLRICPASLRKSITGFRLPGAADTNGVPRAVSAGVANPIRRVRRLLLKSGSGVRGARSSLALVLPRVPYANPKVKMLGGS